MPEHSRIRADLDQPRLRATIGAFHATSPWVIPPNSARRIGAGGSVPSTSTVRFTVASCGGEVAATRRVSRVSPRPGQPPHSSGTAIAHTPSMRLDRFTTLAQEAIASAQSAANTAGHGEVSPLHLLAAMLQERQSVAASILSKAGVDPARVLQVAETELRRLPTVQGSSPQGGQSLMSVLAAAEKEATKLKDGYISSEHLLLALSDVPGPGREVLSARRRRPQAAARGDRADPQGFGRRERERPRRRRQLRGAQEVRDRPQRTRRRRQDRSGHRPRRGDPPLHAGALAAHEEQPRADRRARRRQDRDRRGARAAHRQRRLPGLDEGGPHRRPRRRAAARRREVPRRVRGAPQGGPPRGRLERRAGHPLHRRAAHDRRRRRRPRAPSSAGNLLKPALARGELRCIGATTLDEYRKHIEKDPAFERRFQPVYVGEPSVEDTIAILRGLKNRYEAHHGVRIQDARARRRGDARPPLHRRPLPSRQGDRPAR